MSALVVVLLLAVAFCPGDAIKCYTCMSEQDPQCADPFDRARMELSDCSMDSVQKAIDSVTSFMKSMNDRFSSQLFPHGDTTLEVPMVCQKIDLIGVDGRNHTARMCSLKDQQHGDLCRDFRNKISPQSVSFCGVCEEDGCNSAPHTVMSAALPLSVVCLLLSLR